jgi:hypothetical protein
MLFLGSGRLTSTASARCGSPLVPCPTVQLQFLLAGCNEDNAPDLLDANVRFHAYHTAITARIENCTIAVTARALSTSAYFGIPRIGAVFYETTFVEPVAAGILFGGSFFMLLLISAFFVFRRK